MTKANNTMVTISKATGMKITYVPITKIYKDGDRLLNQKFKAIRDDGAEWIVPAVKLSGKLTEVGQKVAEIRLNVEKED